MRNALRTVVLMVQISCGPTPCGRCSPSSPPSARWRRSRCGRSGSASSRTGSSRADAGEAVRGVALVLGLTAVHRLMLHASLNVRMRLRENTQLYLDSHIMGMTAGIPGLEHHERPEYLDQVELIRNERGYLANPFNPISWTLASLAQGVQHDRPPRRREPVAGPAAAASDWRRRGQRGAARTSSSPSSMRKRRTTGSCATTTSWRRCRRRPRRCGSSGSPTSSSGADAGSSTASKASGGR